MTRHIFYCKACDVFTMKERCPQCKGETFSTIPARFSPEDKWGKYRRIAKQELA